MNYLLYAFLGLIVFQSYAQQKDQDLRIKYGVTQTQIEAFQYDKGELIKQKHHVLTYDRYGNQVGFKTLNTAGDLITETRSYYSEDGQTKYDTIRDANEALKHLSIITRHRAQRYTQFLKIAPKGDTLVQQLKYVDRNLNDSILFNIKNKKRLTLQKWDYNDGGMLISKSWYDEKGRLKRQDEYTYHINGKCKKIRNKNRYIVGNQCKDKLTTIDKFSYPQKAELYGITLNYEKGGKRIITRNDMGLTESLEVVSKKGKRLAFMSFQYQMLNNQ
ncbi:hypothetical protein [Winogradskyella rapida]|uniref:YD repeat-containing protein n=1 Tax=Winogradskyella rapida TaxID=549701 RepID=A0ABW3KPK2_9FLAO